MGLRETDGASERIRLEMSPDLAVKKDQTTSPRELEWPAGDKGLWKRVSLLDPGSWGSVVKEFAVMPTKDEFAEV